MSKESMSLRRNAAAEPAPHAFRWFVSICFKGHRASICSATANSWALIAVTLARVFDDPANIRLCLFKKMLDTSTFDVHTDKVPRLFVAPYHFSSPCPAHYPQHRGGTPMYKHCNFSQTVCSPMWISL